MHTACILPVRSRNCNDSPDPLSVRSGFDSSAHVQERSREQLVSVLDSKGYEVVQSDPLYVQATYSSRSGTDTLEFLFTEDDNTVQLRGLPATSSFEPVLVSRRTLQGKFETLRKALRWQEVVILRNRKRLFGIIQSPFDSFGDAPPLGELEGYDSAW